jgi:hypothetical protein
MYILSAAFLLAVGLAFVAALFLKPYLSFWVDEA